MLPISIALKPMAQGWNAIGLGLKQLNIIGYLFIILYVSVSGVK